MGDTRGASPKGCSELSSIPLWGRSRSCSPSCAPPVQPPAAHTLAAAVDNAALIALCALWRAPCGARGGAAWMRDTHSDPYGDLGTGSCCALDIHPQADPRVWDSPVPQTIINVTCICPATSISPAAVRCCHHTIASRCWLPMPGAFPGCRITAQLPFSCRIYTPVLGFPAKFHYYICSFLRLVIKHSGHGLHRYAGDIPVSQNGAPGRLLTCFICSSVLLMSRCS